MFCTSRYSYALFEAVDHCSDGIEITTPESDGKIVVSVQPSEHSAVCACLVCSTRSLCVENVPFIISSLLFYVGNP